MEKKERNIFLIVLCGIAAFAVLMNLSRVGSMLETLVSFLMPVIAGGVIAIFLNVPATGLEKLLDRMLGRCKKKPSRSFIRTCSLVITLVIIASILALVCTLVVPELARSFNSLYRLLEKRIPVWMEYLNDRGLDAEWLQNFINGLDLENTLRSISQGAGALLGGALDVVFSTVSAAVTFIFALVIGMYMTAGKERLCRHSKKLAYAYLKRSWADGLTRFCRLFGESFAKFLSGQCVEAVILGTLIFLTFLIFGLPYSGLAGIFTAVCALIPYVGAFLSFAVSVLLTLIADPAAVLKCAIVYIAVQFAETQFIYPRVVGSSVGLPPLYTLIAALLGAKLFGIIGILFFIPLTAVIYTLIKNDAARRAQKSVK